MSTLLEREQVKAPEAWVVRGVSGGWNVVCECGYGADEIVDRAIAEQVIVCHCRATGHHRAP